MPVTEPHGQGQGESTVPVRDVSVTRVHRRSRSHHLRGRPALGCGRGAVRRRRGHGAGLRGPGFRQPLRAADCSPCSAIPPSARTGRLHHRWAEAPRRMDRPTTLVTSALGLPVSEDSAGSEETSDSDNDRMKTGPAGRIRRPAATSEGGRGRSALQDHHAQREYLDTGSTRPSCRHRSRALRNTTGWAGSCSGCPPRYSIALETGGPSDELIEGSQ